jgi:hypothetical protein
MLVAVGDVILDDARVGGVNQHVRFEESALA